MSSASIVMKTVLPRRTVLRGIGAAVALPFLDAMVPAFASAQSRSAAGAIKRLGVVYVPNGMAMAQWTPRTEGSAFELSPLLETLGPHRERLLVLSGLDSKPKNAGTGFHARASTRFLTGVPPKLSIGSSISAETSMDQRAAQILSQQTELSSLEVSLDGRDFGGGCDIGFSCAYTNTIAWRSPTTPLPMENDPRVVFERMFGDSGTTDSAVLAARARQQRSILDHVRTKLAALQRELGAGDRVKMGEYLDAVRDVERRIQKAEAENHREVTVVDQPAGIPAGFDDHAKLMYDLQLLAFQSDVTRVTTFMVGRELTGRTYSHIGVPDAHHPLSHHQNSPVNLTKLAKINTLHLSHFRYYLDRLASTRDGNESLLDSMLLLYGAGMSDSQQHSYVDLPIALVAGQSTGLKTNRHIKYPAETPLANLHVTLLERMGVSGISSVGDSTRPLDIS